MQEIGDKTGEGATLMNIGVIQHAKGEYAAALKHLEQSLRIMQKIGDKLGERHDPEQHQPDLPGAGRLPHRPQVSGAEPAHHAGDR
jgi:hypothetical protein